MYTKNTIYAIIHKENKDISAAVAIGTSTCDAWSSAEACLGDTIDELRALGYVLREATCILKKDV